MKKFSTPALVALLLFVGPALVFPQIPFQALALGADPWTVALLLTADIAVTFVVAPVFGSLSDRLGRKPITLLGLAFLPASFAILANSDSIWMLAISRLVMGVGLGVRPVLQAYLVDQRGEAGRLSPIASVNGIYALAFVIGPLGASFILSNQDDGYALVALCAAGCSILAFAIAALYLRGAAEVEPKPTRTSRQSSPNAVFPHGENGALLAVQALLAFVFSGMAATIGPWSASSLNWDARTLSLAFAVAGLAAVVSQFGPIGLVVRNFGEKLTVYAHSALMLIGLMLLIVVPSSGAAVVAIALIGWGSATSLSCLQARASNLTPVRHQGALFGATMGANSIARILGPLWGGFCYMQFWPSAPYLSGVLVVLSAMVLLNRTGSHARAAPGVLHRRGS